MGDVPATTLLNRALHASGHVVSSQIGPKHLEKRAAAHACPRRESSLISDMLYLQRPRLQDAQGTRGALSRRARDTKEVMLTAADGASLAAWRWLWGYTPEEATCRPPLSFCPGNRISRPGKLSSRRDPTRSSRRPAQHIPREGLVSGRIECTVRVGGGGGKGGRSVEFSASGGLPHLPLGRHGNTEAEKDSVSGGVRHCASRRSATHRWCRVVEWLTLVPRGEAGPRRGTRGIQERSSR